MVVRVPNQRRKSQLDLLHDSERDTQRQPSLFTRDDHRDLPAESGDKAFQLELEWLAVGCVQLFAVDKRGDIRRPRPNLGRIEVRLQPIVLARARREIERQVLALLKDSNLSLSFPRDAARRDVRDGSRHERHASVGDVQHGGQNRNADGGDLMRLRPDQGEEQVDVVNHQIEHDGDVGAARAERRQPFAVDEPRSLDVRQRGAYRAIEPLDVTDLNQHSLLAGEIEECICLFESCRDRLFDEDVLPARDRGAGDVEMRRRGHDYHDAIRCIEQRLERRVAAGLQFFFDFRPALWSRLEETTELNPFQIAQNSYVVEPETARADDADARNFRQITTPRSLASTNRINSSTSGSASISAWARSIACVTFISERKRSRYARFSSRIVVSSIPLRCNPTVLSP